MAIGCIGGQRFGVILYMRCFGRISCVHQLSAYVALGCMDSLAVMQQSYYYYCLQSQTCSDFFAARITICIQDENPVIFALISTLTCMNTLVWIVLGNIWWKPVPTHAIGVVLALVAPGSSMNLKNAQ